MLKFIFYIVILIVYLPVFSQQEYSFKLAVLKYQGGGDYYANPTSVPNLIKFANKNFNANINPEVPYVEVGSPELFSYPFIHMTGHGNVVFSATERENLRTYLLGGGFLHIDDNFGMDKFIRPEIKKLFPNHLLVELPFSYPIFHQKYPFPHGLPKIHEHDGGRPRAYGVIIDGRLVLLYTFDTDLGDGWEDVTVHNDPKLKHIEALKMGANILQFVLLKGGIE